MYGRTAQTDEEFRQLTNRDRWGLVQSAADYVEFVDRFQDDERHVLSKCSEEAIDDFGESLIFMNGGLAGANLGILEDELDDDDIETLVESFGLSGRLMADHKGYRCAGRGTCKKAFNYICTGNCFAPDFPSGPDFPYLRAPPEFQSDLNLQWLASEIQDLREAVEQLE